MTHAFDLPVIYKGKELIFPGNLVTLGYTYKIEIVVYDNVVVFERDEEGNLRAIAEPKALNLQKIDAELIHAIAKALVELTT